MTANKKIIFNATPSVCCFVLVSGYEKGYLRHISLSMFLDNCELENNFFSTNKCMTKIGNLTKVIARLSVSLRDGN